MATNNNSKYKQENELLKISPLIRSLGYTPNFNMCGDKPDICLPSFENKEIGIEVTEYAERYHVKVESNEKVRGDLLFKARQDLKNILDSYIDYFDNREKDNRYYPKKSGYRITIWFAGGLFPYQYNLKDYKDDIFKEIDNYLFPSNIFIDKEFIADVRLDSIPNASKTVIDYQRGYVDCMTPIVDSIISEIIKEKNDKLQKYKECKGNESIKEFWLAICLPNHIQDVTGKYRVTSDVQTSYDKIYFVQDSRVWQVK